jgi:ABC-type proline/glycine betaine transport system permease subunit
MVDNHVILAGAVPAAGMALAAYWLLGLLQRVLAPVRG